MAAILHLSVDGTLRAPRDVAGSEHRFDVNLPAREIRLLSGSARPLDLALSDDRRRLGVKIHAIRFAQSGRDKVLPLDAGEFVDGFHRWEQASFRFTDGDAVLPPVLLPPWQGEVSLCIDARPWRGSAQPHSQDPDRLLMEGFDGLGANCELGFVQRHFGAAGRIGLLTWSSIAPARLPAALDQGFHGVGDPARARVVWMRGEYFLETPWVRTHTGYFEPTDAAGERAILERGCARMRLLRRKLLADLATGPRLFVHAAQPADLPAQRMRDIHAALRRHGSARLLCVTDSAPATPGRPAVHPVADGLYAARLDRFVAGHGPYDAWLALCKEARILDDAHH